METHVASERDAKALAEAVLGPRLAACANWFAIGSAYWWKGKLVREGEWRLTLTTAPGRLKALVAEVERRHPYEVAYLSWGADLEVPPAYARWALSASSDGPVRRHRRRPRAARRTR